MRYVIKINELQLKLIQDGVKALLDDQLTKEESDERSILSGMLQNPVAGNHMLNDFNL